MSTEEMINRSVFEEPNLARYQKSFQSDPPIRHIVIDNFLNEEIARGLHENFPGLDKMSKHYHGINERKGESSDFINMHPLFQKLPELFSSLEFLSWLEKLTGIQSLETIHDRLGYGLHQGGNNSFLDIHIDYNIHPVKRLQRKLNLILFFNPGWKHEWGGQLELWDSKVKNCIQSIEPVLNRCVIFECSEISYHGYKKISVPENVTRKSYYQYFFIPTEKGLAYHDTVFKARPEEKASKKIATPLKEFAKNTIKKVLYYTGLKRYLK